MLRAIKLFAFLCCVAPSPVAAETVIVKLGTLAPEGSIWHDALLQVRQRWEGITGGTLKMRIYAGGVLGDEAEMVRKLQRRSLDAVAITAAGLPHIDGSLEVLNIPVLFDSLAELEYVRAGISPRLERRMEQRGFKVLNWSDAGWVYFFTNSPVRLPDDLKRLRLRVSAGAPESERLFKEFGFRVVPLAITDTLTALQTGLIEAINVPPLFALLDRSYQRAGYMTDLRWAPLNAATVISLGAWRRISSRHHPALVAAIREIAGATQDAIRRAGDDAIAEMKARGLKVVPVDAAALAAWRREARAAYPSLRTMSGFPKLFDEVLRLAGEYKENRAHRSGAAAARRP